MIRVNKRKTLHFALLHITNIELSGDIREYNFLRAKTSLSLCSVSIFSMISPETVEVLERVLVCYCIFIIVVQCTNTYCTYFK